jgi:hypothetical protein
MSEVKRRYNKRFLDAKDKLLIIDGLLKVEDNPTWPEVGSLGYVNKQLDIIIQFLESGQRQDDSQELDRIVHLENYERSLD